MGKTDEILRFLQYLDKEGIRFTNDFVDDVKKLVKTDIPTFAKCFYSAFARKDFTRYNKFEKLKLTPKQKTRLDGSVLWRYEYRGSSNFRCIFFTESEYNTSTPILVCAFNEDGDKKQSSNSYAHNIERAINILENL